MKSFYVMLLLKEKFLLPSNIRNRNHENNKFGAKNINNLF